MFWNDGRVPRKGDRVAPRTGVTGARCGDGTVVAAAGGRYTVRWDDGHEITGYKASELQVIR
jgi:hypothetical protein